MFKEYIQKKIAGMIEDEGKFEEYQQFCRMRQTEQLMEAGQLGKAGTNKAAASLFKGESSDSSEDDEQDVSHGTDQKKSKKAARFDFDHPSAFLFRNADPTTGKRPDNFVIKNRERVAYGAQNEIKINNLKLQYRLQNEAAVRSKHEENERESYKRKFFLVIRQSILKQLKEQHLDELCEIRKMRKRIKDWISLAMAKHVVLKAKLYNFDKLVEKKEHEKYKQRCSTMIYRNFKHFLKKKSASGAERRRRVCRQCLTMVGHANVGRRQMQAREIIVALLQENDEIESTIKKVVRFSKIVELTQRLFKRRKAEDQERIAQIQQHWLKVVTERVQEKLK